MKAIFNQLMKEANRKADRESNIIFIDDLSDLDYGYNHESGKYDLPAIEWDGIYGKHWEYFRTEEERNARLEKHKQDIRNEQSRVDALAKKYYAELLSAYMSNRPTLGNLCPQLAKLKTATL